MIMVMGGTDRAPAPPAKKAKLSGDRDAEADEEALALKEIQAESELLAQVSLLLLIIFFLLHPLQSHHFSLLFSLSDARRQVAVFATRCE